MKRLIPLVLLSACSATAAPAETTMSPLPTIVYVPLAQPSGLGFSDIVREYYDGYVPYDNEALHELGLAWCEALEAGMTGESVMSRIQEGAIDNDDAALHVVIVNVAVATLCPDMADQLHGKETQ